MDKIASLSARAKQNPGVATFRYAGVKVAGTGFQVPLVFRGKTYFVIRAGDAGGIFSPVARLQERDQREEHAD